MYYSEMPFFSLLMLIDNSFTTNKYTGVKKNPFAQQLQSFSYYCYSTNIMLTPVSFFALPVSLSLNFFYVL